MPSQRLYLHRVYLKGARVLRSARVVEGDPLPDISVLQDPARLSVMRGGQFVTRNFSQRRDS